MQVSSVVNKRRVEKKNKGGKNEEKAQNATLEKMCGDDAFVLEHQLKCTHFQLLPPFAGKKKCRALVHTHESPQKHKHSMQRVKKNFIEYMLCE